MSTFVPVAWFGTASPAAVAAVVGLSALLALLGLYGGQRAAAEEREAVTVATRLPRGEGVPTLIDVAHARFRNGENGVTDRDLRLLDRLILSLEVLESGSPHFDSEGQEKLAQVVLFFYIVGAMRQPAIFARIHSLTRALVFKGTYQPAIDALAKVERWPAIMPFQRTMRAMIHEVRLDALMARTRPASSLDAP